MAGRSVAARAHSWPFTIGPLSLCVGGCDVARCMVSPCRTKPGHRIPEQQLARLLHFTEQGHTQLRCLTCTVGTFTQWIPCSRPKAWSSLKTDESTSNAICGCRMSPGQAAERLLV